MHTQTYHANANTHWHTWPTHPRTPTPMRAPFLSFPRGMLNLIELHFFYHHVANLHFPASACKQAPCWDPTVGKSPRAPPPGAESPDRPTLGGEFPDWGKQHSASPPPQLIDPHCVFPLVGVNFAPASKFTSVSFGFFFWPASVFGQGFFQAGWDPTHRREGSHQPTVFLPAKLSTPPREVDWNNVWQPGTASLS